MEKVKYEISYEYETDITYTCPVRGVVIEKVTVKRYANQISPDEQVVR